MILIKLYDCSLLNHDTSAKFWESAQKPPGGHACAARRHISAERTGFLSLSCLAVDGIPLGDS